MCGQHAGFLNDKAGGLKGLKSLRANTVKLLFGCTKLCTSGWYICEMWVDGMAGEL